MSSLFKKYGAPAISLLTAVAVVISALVFKGTEHENTWLWVFVVGSLLASFAELYAKRKGN